MPGRTLGRPVMRVGASVVTVLLVAGCALSSPEPRQTARAPEPAKPSTSWATVLNPFSRPETPRVRRTRGYYKVGRPYQIKGKWYTPREDPTYDRTGIASFYAGDFHNKLTANGETFDMTSLTAAHKTLPMPSYVIVENLENGRKLKVRVNDRGPFVDGRIIDLSRRSAKLLGFKRQGLARVRVRYVGPAPLDGSTDAEFAFLQRQGWARRMGLLR